MQEQPNGSPTQVAQTLLNTNEPPQFVGKSQDTQFKPGQSGNPNGRPKGSKNWSTVVQDMLFDEDFVSRVERLLLKRNPVWDKLPNKNFAYIIVSSMLLKASGGDKQAAEWLRKTGFGDKLDITSNDEPIAAPGVASQNNAELFASFMKQQVLSKSDVAKTTHHETTDAPKIVQQTTAIPSPAVQPQADQAAPLAALQPTVAVQVTPPPAQQPVSAPSQVPAAPIPTQAVQPTVPQQQVNQRATAAPAAPAPIQQQQTSVGAITQIAPAQGQPYAY